MYMTITRRIYASLAVIMLTSAAASARDINVRGIVTNTKGEPLRNSTFSLLLRLVAASPPAPTKRANIS